MLLLPTPPSIREWGQCGECTVLKSPCSSSHPPSNREVVKKALLLLPPPLQQGGGQKGVAPPPDGGGALEQGGWGEEQGYFLVGNNLQHPHHPYTLLLPTRADDTVNESWAVFQLDHSKGHISQPILKTMIICFAFFVLNMNDKPSHFPFFVKSSSCSAWGV